MRKSLGRRRSIHEVWTKACRETIAEPAVKPDEELGYVVLYHVNSAIDLVAAEAKYHDNCYASYRKLPSVRKYKSTRKCFDRSPFSYLRENDEC